MNNERTNRILDKCENDLRENRKCLESSPDGSALHWFFKGAVIASENILMQLGRFTDHEAIPLEGEE